MFYFHAWLQNQKKFLVWSENYYQFGIYQLLHVFLLEPRQSNLSNPKVYLEPCQTFNMECFAKMVNGKKSLTIFLKQSILDVQQGSEYTSAIYYSLLGKTEDPNNIDSVTM